MKKKALQNNRNRRATQLIVTWRKQGETLQGIANRLNNNGFQTVRGKKFQPTTVKFLYDRHRTGNRVEDE